MITLEHPKLAKLITDKDILVTEGRKISGEIDKIERKVKEYEEKEKRITAKVVPPKELTDKGDDLVKQITKLNIELTAIADSINKSKMDAIPEEMIAGHKLLLKEKESLERERNKVALKVQKIKDKCVPLIQKEVKPHLKREYDDIETARVKDGKVVISTYNRLDDWKKTFNR